MLLFGYGTFRKTAWRCAILGADDRPALLAGAQVEASIAHLASTMRWFRDRAPSTGEAGQFRPAQITVSRLRA